MNEQQQPQHLVVLVNGLWSCAKHWRVMEQEIGERLGPQAVVHTVQSVSWWTTLTGISSCGGKVAEEVQSIVQQHSSLKTMSFVGHSMVSDSNICLTAQRASKQTSPAADCQHSQLMWAKRHLKTCQTRHL